MTDNECNDTKKDIYDNVMGGGNGDLFSIISFDEMQKIKNYEIGFKLFRTFFWIMHFVSVAVIFAAYVFANTVFILIGYGIMILCSVFFLLYAVKSSAAGVMNQKFAERMSKKPTLFCGILIFAVWLYRVFDKTDVVDFAAAWVIAGLEYIGVYFCARRNMKVLEKMLSEDSEE